MRYLILFTAFFFICKNLPAQPGCTDPQALNYNTLATVNDGSCTYPSTSYTPQQIAQLPASLQECSGLSFFENRLWTHEDGGNQDKLYVIDTATAALLQTITIANTSNIDWEDLAQDDTWIYIGDFGNNEGNRTNLRILRINKSSLLSGTATPQLIEFSYSDQTVFTSAPNANDYDCEAFFFWQDSLHLFSKNWVNFKTRHYVLPATPGVHVAQLRDSLNVQGQITGADVSPDGKAVLLGYNVSTSETFLWLLFDFPGSQVFKGNKRKISLGSALLVSQPEGITFRNAHYGYICSERYSALPQKLLSFDIKQWAENPVDARELLKEAGISISPNPFSEDMTIECGRALPGKSVIELMDAGGRILKRIARHNIGQHETVIFETARLQLSSGVYWLSIKNGREVFRGKVVKE